jgi:RNA polymerase subunit RPABC4/transcription elongation factor Spt4
VSARAPSSIVPIELSVDELRTWFEFARDLFTIHRLNEQQYQALMHAMLAGDTVGNMWTIGTASERWYRWDTDRWVPGEPAGPLYLAAPAEALDRFEKMKEVLASLDRKHEPEARAAACRQCGAPLAADVKFCPNCGTQVVAPPPRPDVAPQALMVCARCAAVLPAGARFCPQCGTAVEPPKPAPPPAAQRPAYCPRCGARVRPGNRFCTDCGADL